MSLRRFGADRIAAEAPATSLLKWWAGPVPLAGPDAGWPAVLNRPHHIPARNTSSTISGQVSYAAPHSGAVFASAEQGW